VDPGIDQRALDLLGRALALPVADRTAFIDEGCRGDAVLSASLAILQKALGPTHDRTEKARRRLEQLDGVPAMGGG